MDGEDLVCASPPGPPPLLSVDQMLHLARQGWLSHMLPEDLVDTVTELFTKSANFFVLQNDEKAKLYPAKSLTEFGYYPVPTEKEYITFRCRIHTAADSIAECIPQLKPLEDIASKAWRQCGLLLLRLLCDLARWSGLHPHVWNDILDGTLTMPETEDQATSTLLRLFRYLPETGIAESHADLGLLTICIGDRGGLEVLDRMQSTTDKPIWIDPASNSRTATILIGRSLKALSGDTFNTGVHRVIGNPQGRQSIVFALRPSTRHDVDLSLFGGEGRMGATEFWEYIKAGIVNINMDKNSREAQRARKRARESSDKGRPELTTSKG